MFLQKPCHFYMVFYFHFFTLKNCFCSFCSPSLFVLLFVLNFTIFFTFYLFNFYYFLLSLCFHLFLSCHSFLLSSFFYILKYIPLVLFSQFMDFISPRQLESVFISSSIHLKSLKFIYKVGTVKPTSPPYRDIGGKLIFVVNTS